MTNIDDIPVLSDFGLACSYNAPKNPSEPGMQLDYYLSMTGNTNPQAVLDELIKKNGKLSG